MLTDTLPRSVAGPLTLARLKSGARDTHAADWLACESDAAHFINAFVVIDEPHGEGVATVPFRLWPAQADSLARMMIEPLIIFLKARQLGLTWLVCAYGLWLCLFQAGRVVLCFSKTQDDADELIRRFKAMYLRLPDWIRSRRPLTVDNMGELAWGNESRVESRAATKGAGRSFAASLVILDEFAFMQYMQETYTAVKPTVDGGGQMFVLSTANGESGLFFDLWDKAVKLVNNFVAIFLSWRADPRRTEEWRAKVRADAISSALDRQEYPETAEEAFQNTGGENFLPSMDLWDILIDPDLPALTPYEPIILAADAATGRADDKSDCFGLIAVSEHPKRPGELAIRYARKWQAAKGQHIDFDGTDDYPGPIAEAKRLHRDYSVYQFTYDPKELVYVASLLAAEGIYCDPFNQQGERLIGDRLLFDLISQRRIRHTGDADLREHIANADRQINAQDRTLRIVKRTESKKIDMAVCCSMACKRHRDLWPAD